MIRFLGILLLIALVVAGAFFWEDENFIAAGPFATRGASETDVMIKPGVGLRGIAQELRNAGVVPHSSLFIWGVRLRRTAAGPKAGEYAIPSRASMLDIMEILISGKTIQHKITAAEGLTSGMIAKLVAADTVLTGVMVPTPPEGTLLPQT